MIMLACIGGLSYADRLPKDEALVAVRRLGKAPLGIVAACAQLPFSMHIPTVRSLKDYFQFLLVIPLPTRQIWQHERHVFTGGLSASVRLVTNAWVPFQRWIRRYGDSSSRRMRAQVSPGARSTERSRLHRPVMPDTGPTEPRSRPRL